MILRYITIRNLGEVDHFKYDFEDGLNIVKNRYTDEIIHAIQFVLRHRISSLPEHWVKKDTQIVARVCVAEKEYQIVIQNESNPKDLCLRAYDKDRNDATKDYLYLTSHCIEQDISDVFCGEAGKTFFRLLEYLDEDQYYASRELSMRTDKLSETKSFRSYLKAFIKDFRPELIREEKGYALCLEKNGKYTVRNKDDNGLPVFLSESEQTIFRYLCFLRTAEFWQGFEELRNLHGTKKPLVVSDFLERLDESIDVSCLLQRAVRLNRQLIILTI